jgi:hypothetical protein
MTDIQNPTAFSDYDWLEFVSFVWKVENEGYEYAAEHYGPDFEDTGLPVDGDDLRDLYDRYFDAVETWAEAVGGQEACDLHNAHVDESRKREDNACLWGVRCTDGFVIHEKTEEAASRTAAHLLANAGKGWRVPVALLQRSAPGGEWTESATASAGIA